MAVAVAGTDAFFPLVGFALGAFPIAAINSLLRRLAGRALNDSELKDNKDDLLKMSGVTPDVSDQLKDAGAVSPPQLADTDPVSLTLRTGLPFDFVINLAAQGQVWSYLGATAAALTPYGYGDARAIAKLMDPNNAAQQACLDALARKCLVDDKIQVDACLLTAIFEAIARDAYTQFLVGISRLADAPDEPPPRPDLQAAALAAAKAASAAANQPTT
jgi:hypothetical protein